MEPQFQPVITCCDEPSPKITVSKCKGSKPDEYKKVGNKAAANFVPADAIPNSVSDFDREASFAPTTCSSAGFMSQASNDDKSSPTLKLLSIVLLIALFCGLANYVLHLFVSLASCPLGIESCPWKMQAQPWWVRAIVCSCAGFVLGKGVSVFDIEKHVRGGGSRMVHNSLLHGRQIPLIAAFFRLIITSINLGVGIPLGYEAPSIFISTSVAQSVGIYFQMRSPNALSILASVGAASGVAAVFNSPMSGVAYAMEEVAAVSLNKFTKNIVVFIMISASTAAAVQRRLHDAWPYSDSKIFRPHGAVDTWGPKHFPSEIWLPLAFIMGLLAVTWGTWWIRITLWVRKRVNYLPLWKSWGVCGLLVSIIQSLVQVFLVGDTCHPWGVRGDFLDKVNDKCDGRSGWTVFVVLLVTKGVTSVICASVDSSGGLLGPTLTTGALLGGSFGHLVSWLLNEQDSRVYVEPCVCLGMCSLFGTVFRFPVTGMLVILELAAMESYHMILPIAFASATASWCGSMWLRMSSWVHELLEQEAVLNPEVPETDDANMFKQVFIKRGAPGMDDEMSPCDMGPDADSHATLPLPSRLECELMRDFFCEDRPSDKSFASRDMSLISHYGKDSPSLYSFNRHVLPGAPNFFARRPSHGSVESNHSESWKAVIGARRPSHPNLNLSSLQNDSMGTITSARKGSGDFTLPKSNSFGSQLKERGVIGDESGCPSGTSSGQEPQVGDHHHGKTMADESGRPAPIILPCDENGQPKHMSP